MPEFNDTEVPSDERNWNDAEAKADLEARRDDYSERAMDATDPMNQGLEEARWNAAEERDAARAEAVPDPSEQQDYDDISDLQEEMPMSAVFRGLNLKLPSGAFREAIKRESPKRTRDGQSSDPTGPIEKTDYGSDDYSAALGDQPILIIPDGEAYILPPGATPTEHPDTMGVLGDWDRDGIMRRFVGRKDWSVAMKPSAAEAAEWDHVQLSLSRQAGEEATPEQVQQAVAILVEVLRTPPLRFTRDGDPETFQRWLAEKRITRGDVLGIDGSRMVHVLPVHDNTDNVHVQAFVHRHSIDVAKREVGAAIKQHEPIVARGQVAALNALLAANGLPFTVTSGFDRVNAGQGAVLDTEQAAEIVRSIEDAGGVAPARLTTGQQGQLAGQAAVPTVAPEANRITASIDEDARDLARMKADMDILASRIAAKQHAVAAIQEAAMARAAQAEAEAIARAAEAEKEALQDVVAGEPQRTTVAVREALEPVQAALTAAEELAALEPERRAAAVLVAVEPVQAELAAALELAALEPERQAAAVREVVTPVLADLDGERARAAALEAEKADLEAMVADEPVRLAAAVQVAVLPIEVALAEAIRTRDEALAAEAESKDRLANVEAELAEERRTLPEKIAAAVKEAVDREVARVSAAYEATIAAKDQVITSMQRQIDGLDARVGELLARVGELIERIANIPSVALATVGSAATKASEAIRQPSTEERYFETDPEEWSEQQAERARLALVRDQAKSPRFRNLDSKDHEQLKEFGQKAYEANLKKKAPKGSGGGGSAPPTPSGP